MTAFKDREFVFVGRRTDRDGQAFSTLAPLDADGKLPAGGSLLHFKLKRGSGTSMAVGHVYRISGDEEGDHLRLDFSTREWVREHDNEAAVMEWQAQTTAADRAARAKAMEKREATNTSALDRATEQLRRAYKRIPAGDRIAFEVWLLAQLRK